MGERDVTGTRSLIVMTIPREVRLLPKSLGRRAVLQAEGDFEFVCVFA